MKRFKSEKGVITMITLITVLFMVSFLISAYVVVANKVKTQKEMLAETKAVYEPKSTMEEIYNSYFSNDNVIPIYTAEQLLKIGEAYTNLDGKYYNNDENTRYILMDDIEFNAVELGLTTDWTPIDENANFPGIFDWNDNTITVTNLKRNIEFYDGQTRITEIVYENLEEDASADIKTAVDEGKIEKVLEETINGKETIAVVPTGYNVSTKKGEYTLSGGLVITDGENEFVWIPVSTNFKENYNVTSSNGVKYSEPTIAEKSDENSGYPYDSQDNLNYYYGQNDDETDYYDFETDFNYSLHYSEMVTSINTYNGFYVGRYETTIDENGNIGSRKNTIVLATKATLDNEKKYLWWGLYYTQRNCNVKGNGDYVQTSMVWGQQWDALNTFLGRESGYGITGTQTQVLKSGEAIYDDNIKDILNNIYDLRRNVYEYTAEYQESTGLRVRRGGRYNVNATTQGRYNWVPNLGAGSVR